MMVACHKADLLGARGCGLRTAFVPRPAEPGPDGIADTSPNPRLDLTCAGFGELADRLRA